MHQTLATLLHATLILTNDIVQYTLLLLMYSRSFYKTTTLLAVSAIAHLVNICGYMSLTSDVRNGLIELSRSLTLYFKTVSVLPFANFLVCGLGVGLGVVLFT